jgi:two-component system response regulator PilR (NtrC family)
LQDHDYPGNVRELENIIERAVTLSDGRIGADAIPELKRAPRIGASDAGRLPLPDDGIDLDRVLTDYERELIERALDQSGGVRKRAANLLGVTFRSLRYRLSKLGLAQSGDDETG